LLVVDYQVGAAFSDGAVGSGLVVTVLDFQRAKVGFDFATARVGIQLEAGFVGR